jgi:hypothetical protein
VAVTSSPVGGSDSPFKWQQSHPNRLRRNLFLAVALVAVVAVISIGVAGAKGGTPQVKPVFDPAHAVTIGEPAPVNSDKNATTGYTGRIPLETLPGVWPIVDGKLAISTIMNDPNSFMQQWFGLLKKVFDSCNTTGLSQLMVSSDKLYTNTAANIRECNPFNPANISATTGYTFNSIGINVFVDYTDNGKPVRNGFHFVESDGEWKATSS